MNDRNPHRRQWWHFCGASASGLTGDADASFPSALREVESCGRRLLWAAWRQRGSPVGGSAGTWALPLPLPLPSRLLSHAFCPAVAQSDALHLGRRWRHAGEVPARPSSGDVRHVHAGATQPGSRGSCVQRLPLSVSDCAGETPDIERCPRCP